MALLNPPQILPNVARVIFRTLQSVDNTGISREELAKLIAPTSLPRGDGATSGAGTRGFDDTLTACLTINLVERTEDHLRLHRDLPPAARDRKLRESAFVPLVLDLILDDRVNHGLWESTEGARDLTRALAWFLAQSTLDPPAAWNDPGGADVVQERQLSGSERIFSNDTRWGAFDRWVSFLGVGTHLPKGSKSVLIPDPTAALRRVLPDVLPSSRQPVLDLVERLGQRLPILDGGAFRRAVEERMRPEYLPPSSDVLSPSLSHALLRLRDERMLTLEDLADAPAKVRLARGFGPERTISHISPPSSPRSRKSTP